MQNINPGNDACLAAVSGAIRALLPGQEYRSREILALLAGYIGVATGEALSRSASYRLLGRMRAVGFLHKTRQGHYCLGEASESLRGDQPAEQPARPIPKYRGQTLKVPITDRWWLLITPRIHHQRAGIRMVLAVGDGERFYHYLDKRGITVPLARVPGVIRSLEAAQEALKEYCEGLPEAERLVVCSPCLPTESRPRRDRRRSAFPARRRLDGVGEELRSRFGEGEVRARDLEQALMEILADPRWRVWKRPPLQGVASRGLARREINGLLAKGCLKKLRHGYYILGSSVMGIS